MNCVAAAGDVRRLHVDRAARVSVQRTFDANNSLTVATDDRLGVYGSASLFGVDKLSVPYAVDTGSSSSSSFQLSRERFDDSLEPFVVGQLQVTVHDESWPRTFSPFLSLCTTASTMPAVYRRQLIISAK